MFYRIDSRFFAFSGRMFEKDEDDIGDGELLVLGDNSDIPDAEPEGCAGGCGCAPPDLRMGFRVQKLAALKTSPLTEAVA